MELRSRRDVLNRLSAVAAGLAAGAVARPAPAARPPTRITRVEVLEAERFRYVKVHTDAGVAGVGELHPASNTGGKLVAPVAAVAYCGEYLLGKDPTEIERHWQHMFRRNVFRGGADSTAAIGAIDMALWDIAGKLAGLPVHKLLGGPTREKVRVYTHLNSLTPEQAADEARRRVEEGFTALRMYPLGDRKEFARLGYAAIVRRAERYVAAVRDAAGPDIDLMIDVVCLLTPPEAIELGRALRPCRLYFFEDPIEPDNIEALAYVASHIPVPVATGERLYTIYQFREVLNRNAAAYLRPDACLAGGLTNSKKIAALAEAGYVGVSPHNPLSCVLTAACVQLCAAVHNIAIQEYPGDEWQKPKRDLVREPVRLEKGYLVVPDRPGLGVELNQEAFRHYPPMPYSRPAVVGPGGGLRDY